MKKTPPSLISEKFEEEDIDPYLPAQIQGDPKDLIWYDSDDISSLDEINDNNEYVDIDNIQRFKINDGESNSNSFVNDNKGNMDKLDFLRKKVETKGIPNKTISIDDLSDGEFALIVKDYLIIKSLEIEDIKKAIVKLITKDKGLKYEHIKVLYKVSLDELFKE